MNLKTTIILIFLILIIAISFVFSQNKRNSELRELTVLEEITIRIKSIDISVNIQNKDNPNFRWIKDGFTILVSATDNFFINKESDKHLEFDIVPELFEKELSIIKKVLNNRGFVLDLENSSTNFSDRSFYDYVQSYKKDNELCVAKVNPDDMGYYQLIFSCGNSLNEAYEEQIHFLNALDLKDKNTIVRLKNQKGDYYEVGVGGVRGGSDAILKKENNNYRVLFVGQESPYCSLIEREDIPNEVLSSIGGGNCFAEDGSYKRF